MLKNLFTLTHLEAKSVSRKWKVTKHTFLLKAVLFSYSLKKQYVIYIFLLMQAVEARNFRAGCS